MEEEVVLKYEQIEESEKNEGVDFLDLDLDKWTFPLEMPTMDSLKCFNCSPVFINWESLKEEEDIFDIFS